MNQLTKGARYVALGALFLVPIAPLIVANSFYFPFITGKAFYLRILIEVAVAAWIVLAVLDARYRPRFSWVGAAVVGFVLWMLIADLTAVNVLKAFWSNFERMEGWVLLIHLLGFFFAASSVLRVEEKWRAWFLTSLGVSLLIVAYSLFQLAGVWPIHQGSTRIDASFGNSAYLAIYFLFNVFLASWLALTEARPWLKYGLFALALVEAVLIFFTETRGTILGLVGALALSALLVALTSGGRARRYAFGAIGVIVIVVGLFIAVRDTAFVRNNDLLNRVSHISLSDGQVRFTIWHMAFEGFGESPKTVLLGWGQEGFNYVFNRYYDPSLYAQEPWFDRAHNAFIDWLVAGGLPAFLLYLALFATALIALWRSPLGRAERIALTAALAGYAFHNLFVFDNLYSYIYFFAILALVDSQVGRPIARLERAPVVGDDLAITASAVALALLAGVIWYVNVPGMQAAGKLIAAISPSPTGGIDQNLDAFEDFAAHPPFAAQEVREQLVSFALSVSQSSSIADADKAKATTLAVSQMQKQVAAQPLDAREHLELALAYRAQGDLKDDLAEIEKAHELSPNKEQILIQEGATYLDAGDPKSAQQAFAAAYALGPQFSDLALYAAIGDLVAGDTAAGKALLTKTFGTVLVDNDTLASIYYQIGDYTDLIGIWKARVAKPDAPIESYFGLAGAYYVAGQKQQAIATLEAGEKAHPESAADVQSAIQQIESGK